MIKSIVLNFKVLAMTFAMLFMIPSIIAQETAEPVTWKFYWDNGFQLKSSDDNFVLKFGGRVQGDFAIFAQDGSLESAFGELNNGYEFRRARFYHSGVVYKILIYKLQLDFGSGKVTFKDVYIGVKGIPGLGTFKFGHFKEPMRLEALTSSKYITFMELAPTVSFMPERNIGIMFNNNHADGHFTWALGVFRRGDATGNQKMAGNEVNVTARLTGLPYYNKEKKHVVHLGTAFSFRNPYSMEYRIKSRPESHLANTLVDTEEIEDVGHYFVAQGEAAIVAGPFSMQGEVIASKVSSSPYDSVAMVTLAKSYTFLAYYAYASYMITGESRPFKTSSTSFSRIKPKKNVGQGGAGAWELAVRYSGIDLNDNDIMGGSMNAFTAGVNWYLNPVSRIMFNYVYSNLKDVGSMHVMQTRFQIDF